MDLVGLTARISNMAIRVEALKRQALKEATQIVEKRAKAKIGEYQGATGPVAAWQPLAPSTVQTRVDQGYSPDEPLERTGELKTNITSGIEGDVGYVGSPDLKAKWAEVGTPTEPPRSWLEGAFYDKRDEVESRIGKIVPQVLTK